MQWLTSSATWTITTITTTTITTITTTTRTTEIRTWARSRASMSLKKNRFYKNLDRRYKILHCLAKQHMQHAHVYRAGQHLKDLRFVGIKVESCCYPTGQQSTCRMNIWQSAKNSLWSVGPSCINVYCTDCISWMPHSRTVYTPDCTYIVYISIPVLNLNHMFIA